MAMTFGDKKKNLPEESRDGLYLRNFKKGETVIRFLEEVDEWTGFKEHYTPDRKSFPCTEDVMTCPGCLSDNEDVRRASRKYATNVQQVKEKRVVPYRIPASLMDRVQLRSDRNGGTVLTRDFVVMKTGTGFDTSYDVDQEDKYAVDTSTLLKEGMNIQEVLNAMYLAANSDEAQAEARSEARAVEAQKERDANQEETPPSSSSPSTTSDDDEEFSEDDIRAMTRAELTTLFEKSKLPVDPDDSRSEMVDKLIKAFGGKE